MTLVLYTIISYILGSLNFSIVLFKWQGWNDPRDSYSGNPGVTNVYRQAGLLWAGLVLLLEIFRAAGIAKLGSYLLPMNLVPALGTALIVGNRFPLFHNFKGGKGVANYLGFTLILSPLWAALAALSWVVAFAVSRESFIGSFFMVAFLSLGTILYCTVDVFVLSAVGITTTLILSAHRNNIRQKMEANLKSNY